MVFHDSRFLIILIVVAIIAIVSTYETTSCKLIGGKDQGLEVS